MRTALSDGYGHRVQSPPLRPARATPFAHRGRQVEVHVLDRDRVLGRRSTPPRPSSALTTAARRAARAPRRRRSRRRGARRRAARAGSPRRARRAPRARRRARATSTRRREFDEFCEPTTSTRSQSPRDRAHRVLAVLGRVADVLGGGHRRGPAGASRSAATIAGGLVDRERRLRQAGDRARRRRARARGPPRRWRSRACARAPRRRCPRPPRGRRGRRARSGSPRRRSGAPRRGPSRPAGRSRRSRRARAPRRASRTAGETPWAEKITVAPCGTSSSSSTNTAPRRSSSPTTCALWTICLRT